MAYIHIKIKEADRESQVEANGLENDQIMELLGAFLGNLLPAAPAPIIESAPERRRPGRPPKWSSNSKSQEETNSQQDPDESEEPDPPAAETITAELSTRCPDCGIMVKDDQMDKHMERHEAEKKRMSNR